jgi:hypothetical protein
MKIDNQDIIRTVRQLRDKENEQLHVSPWNRHHRVHIPAWLVAIPAAAIIGFVLGIWTQADSKGDSTLTALVDTVYIKVPVTPSSQDSVIPNHTAAAQKPVVSTPLTKPAARTPSAKGRLLPSSGRSVADDHIRYDLLVRN